MADPLKNGPSTSQPGTETVRPHRDEVPPDLIDVPEVPPASRRSLLAFQAKIASAKAPGATASRGTPGPDSWPDVLQRLKQLENQVNQLRHLNFLNAQRPLSAQLEPECGPRKPQVDPEVQPDATDAATPAVSSPGTVPEGMHEACLADVIQFETQWRYLWAIRPGCPPQLQFISRPGRFEAEDAMRRAATYPDTRLISLGGPKPKTDAKDPEFDPMITALAAEIASLLQKKEMDDE